MKTNEASNPAPTPARPETPGSRELRILEALSDPVGRVILLTLSERAMTANMLESHIHLPHSSLYRKIHDLKVLELVGVERIEITPQGKRVEILRALVTKVTIEMEGGRLSVRASFRNLAQDRAQLIWGALRQEAQR